MRYWKVHTLNHCTIRKANMYQLIILRVSSQLQRCTSPKQIWFLRLKMYNRPRYRQVRFAARHRPRVRNRKRYLLRNKFNRQLLMFRCRRERKLFRLLRMRYHRWNPRKRTVQIKAFLQRHLVQLY